jgi:hypothetical protein
MRSQCFLIRASHHAEAVRRNSRGMLHAWNLINPSAAGGSPAVATLRIGMQRLFIVHRDFLARVDVAQSEEQHVAMEGADIGVWLAGMVDVMGAIAATTAIDAPFAVHIADAQFGAVGAALSFDVRDSLARVFGDLATAQKMSSCKTTSAVNS